MPLCTEVDLGPGDIVLDDLAPPKKGTGALPHFATHVYCDQTAGWIKMPLGRQVGLVPGHIVLDGDPAIPHGKADSRPPLLAHVYCGQTVAHRSNCWTLVLRSYLKYDAN